MNGLIDTLVAPVRLRICAFLSGCEEADFGAVQQYCELTKSNLSKQLTVLSERGLVEIRKVQAGRYVKTRLRLTDAGEQALSGHLAALQAIAQGAAGVHRT
ncbi:MAG TPA: transcriptional regulator [Jatrophihabitans sp.]|nr:transcriptional regulator [Jatrophihabitans sp.]